MIMKHIEKNRLGYGALLAATIAVTLAAPAAAHHDRGYDYKKVRTSVTYVKVKYVPRRKKKVWRKRKTYKRWTPPAECRTW